MQYRVYVHASCVPNPGPAAAAIITKHVDKEKADQVCLNYPDLTAYNALLQGVVTALERTPPGASVEMITDNKIVVHAHTRSVERWEKSGWRGANKMPIRDQEIMKRAADLAKERVVTWTYAKLDSTPELRQAASLSRGAVRTVKP